MKKKYIKGPNDSWLIGNRETVSGGLGPNIESNPYSAPGNVAFGNTTPAGLGVYCRKSIDEDSMFDVRIGDQVWNVFAAEDPLKGLSNTQGLVPRSGMLFTLPESSSGIPINMSDMKYPIDIIFITSDDKVTKVIREALPKTDFTYSGQPIKYFLEVNAGEAESVKTDEDVEVEDSKIEKEHQPNPPYEGTYFDEFKHRWVKPQTVGMEPASETLTGHLREMKEQLNFISLNARRFSGFGPTQRASFAESLANCHKLLGRVGTQMYDEVKQKKLELGLQMYTHQNPQNPISRAREHIKEALKAIRDNNPNLVSHYLTTFSHDYDEALQKYEEGSRQKIMTKSVILSEIETLKSKEYLDPGEQPPKGKHEQTGSRGGRFYETDRQEQTQISAESTISQGFKILEDIEENTLSNWFKSEPDVVVFHGTSDIYLEEINKNGLQLPDPDEIVNSTIKEAGINPGTVPKWIKNEALYRSPKRPGGVTIFTTTSYTTAKGYSHWGKESIGGEIRSSTYHWLQKWAEDENIHINQLKAGKPIVLRIEIPRNIVKTHGDIPYETDIDKRFREVTDKIKEHESERKEKIDLHDFSFEIVSKDPIPRKYIKGVIYPSERIEKANKNTKVFRIEISFKSEDINKQEGGVGTISSGMNVPTFGGGGGKIRKKIFDLMDKSKVYLNQSESPPKNENILTGPKGGRYYIPTDVTTEHSREEIASKVNLETEKILQEWNDNIKNEGGDLEITKDDLTEGFCGSFAAALRKKLGFGFPVTPIDTREDTSTYDEKYKQLSKDHILLYLGSGIVADGRGSNTIEHKAKEYERIEGEKRIWFKPISWEVVNSFINENEAGKIEKSKVYLQPGEKPPEGKITLRGKKGGTYYETSPHYLDRTKRKVEMPEILRTADGSRVPPAWTNVWVSSNKNSEVQAVGRDIAGRRVFIYSATHWKKKEAEKFKRLKAFNKVFDKLKNRIEHDAQKSEEALVLYLIMKTGFRIGTEQEHIAKVKAYGASTLERKHVKISGDRISFDFVGKKGVHITKTIHDKLLAQILGARISSKSSETLFNTTSFDVRNYLHSLPNGSKFKVKDFRTFIANSIALKKIKSLEAPKTIKEFKKSRKYVAESVAKELGNTPAIALKAYIAPEVFAMWEAPFSDLIKKSDEEIIADFIESIESPDEELQDDNSSELDDELEDNEDSEAVEDF